MANHLEGKRFSKLPLLLFLAALLLSVFDSLQFAFLSTAGIEEYKFGGEACLVVSVTIRGFAMTASSFGFYYAMRNLIVGRRDLATMAAVAFNLSLIHI